MSNPLKSLLPLWKRSAQQIGLDVPQDGESSSQNPRPAKRRDKSPKTQYGLTLLSSGERNPTIADGKQFEVDVVAVHGLNGDAFAQWTHKNGTFWLRDLLPSALPGARIFTFGYPSQLWFNRSIADVEDYALRLLSALRDCREGDQEKRPIIFVCYSLGGIVFKKAWVLAKQRLGIYQNICTSTSAVVFLGTPHHGARGTPDIAKVVGHVINFSLKVPGTHGLTGLTKTDLLETVSDNSEELLTLSRSFAGLVPELDIVTFFETETRPPYPGLVSVKLHSTLANPVVGPVLVSTNGNLSKIVEKDSAKLNIPSEYAIPLFANHRNMCKYPSEFSSEYIEVSKSLQRLCRKACHHNDNMVQELVNQKSERLDEAKARAVGIHRLKSSLFFSEVLAREEEVTDAYSGTCEWVFNRSASEDGRKDDLSSSETTSFESGFPEWLRTSDGVYWITGKAGSGKSTLMKHVVNNTRTRHHLELWAGDGDVLLLRFFFWKPGTGLQRNLQGLLRALLWQIIHFRPGMMASIPEAENTFPATDETAARYSQIHAWTEKRLLAALRALVSQLPTDLRLCIFIDGLDEFDGELDGLLNLINYLKQSPGIKLCVSSRPEYFIQDFKDTQQLKTQDANAQDIMRMANGKLSSLLHERFPDRKTDIETLLWNISSYAGGVFLWAELVVRDIKRGLRNFDNFESLRSALNDMPLAIGDMYQRMLDNITTRCWKEAQTYFTMLITWQSYWQRTPLTLLHLAFTDAEAQSRLKAKDWTYFESSDFGQTCERLKQRLYTCCAGLLEIGESLEPFQDIQQPTHCAPESQGATECTRSQILQFARRINFIHRTVEEFVREKQPHIFGGLGDEGHRYKALKEALNAQVGFISLPRLPSGDKDSHHRYRDNQVDDFMNLARELVHIQPTSLGNELTQLDQVMTYAGANRPGRSSNDWIACYARRTKGPDNLHPIPCVDLVGLAAHRRLLNFVKHWAVSQQASLSQLRYLLYCCCSAGGTPFGFPQDLEPLVPWLHFVTWLLRQGADPNFSVCFEYNYYFGNGVKFQYETSFWGRFVDHSSDVIQHYNLSSSSDTIYLRSFIPAWEAAIEAFTLSSAEVNPSSFSCLRIHDYWLIVEESMLSKLQSFPALSTERVHAWLIARGARPFRRCHALIARSDTGDLVYRVNKSQSDRLCHVWEMKICDPEGQVRDFSGALKEMEATLEEEDVITPESICLLRRPQDLARQDSSPMEICTSKLPWFPPGMQYMSTLLGENFLCPL